MRTDTGQTFKLEDYAPPAYLIPAVSLTFKLDPHRTHVRSTLTLRRNAATAAGTPLVLDGDGLTLKGLALNGNPVAAADFEAGADRLVIHVPPDGDFLLTIDTEIAPQGNTSLSGLYRSGGNYCTQCEAEGFRRITYFADRPDILSVYEVRIEALRAEAPILLANGNPLEKGDIGDGRHYAVWCDPWPKPSYLFALVAGDLGAVRDRFLTQSGRTVDLAILVEHGKEDRAHYAMDALKRSMAWDEQVFGLEYDLDVFNIVAVSDFNMGAMENKGLNIFNDKYVLADPQTATDTDYAGIEAIIAHEYFHNWTGNRITCRDWFQLCLKEGLTVFRDHEFSADQRSRAVKRIAEVRTLRAHQFPEDAGPLAHPVRPREYREINNFYTATVYEKGSEVVRMIRTVLGRDNFRKGMDLYFVRHDGQAVTIEDFLKAFEDASGEDLSQFSLWYHQAGTPHLNVTYDHDRQKGEFTISIEQMLAPGVGEGGKRLMHIPVAFALLGHNGHEMEPEAVSGGDVKDGVLHVRKRKHNFRFKGVKERPVVSLLRGFSAPVNVTAVQPRDDLFFLARHDSDLFCRWEALMRIYTNALMAATRDIRGGKRAEFPHDIARIAAEIATAPQMEEAFRAQALSLPAETDLAREIGENVDPDAIHRARTAMTRWLADECSTVFAKVHDQLADAIPFSPDAARAGRRALRSVLVDYLATGTGDPARAKDQFDRADNMTDRMGALQILAHRFPEDGETLLALDAFEQRYSSDALVFDKWFTVQATIPGAQTLERIKRLTAHKAYDPNNPNRVRALVGAFASANQTGFNRKDGAAYGFFADTILSIDGKNPQLAARLLTVMRSWRSLETERREAARSALAGISSTEQLSTDVREIVERILA